jgi:hypothetical protein
MLAMEIYPDNQKYLEVIEHFIVSDKPVSYDGVFVNPHHKEMSGTYIKVEHIRSGKMIAGYTLFPPIQVLALEEWATISYRLNIEAGQCAVSVLCRTNIQFIVEPKDTIILRNWPVA